MDANQTISPNITIFDVAREAGVSYSTVSRVINNKEYVKESTRSKVQMTMTRLGYVANLKARSLAGGRSQVIGVLIYDLETNYTVQIVRGIDEEVSVLDYDMLIATTHQRKVKEANYVVKLTQGLADGLLIILPRNLEAYLPDLHRLNFPYVLVDHPGQDASDTAIQATNFQGAYSAVQHLIELGHTQIATITGPLDLACSQDRLAGYRSALADHGLVSPEAWVMEGDFLKQGGVEGASRLLDLAQPPTAIFAASDLMGFGAMLTAKERGLVVPADLSVVGFDDINESALVVPGLTSVRQPLEEMGRVATRLLVARIENPETVPQRLELATELVIRGTTASPGAKQL